MVSKCYFGSSHLIWPCIKYHEKLQGENATIRYPCSASYRAVRATEHGLSPNSQVRTVARQRGNVFSSTCSIILIIIILFILLL